VTQFFFWIPVTQTVMITDFLSLKLKREIPTFYW